MKTKTRVIMTAALVGLLATCVTVDVKTQVGQGLAEVAHQFLDAADFYDTAYRGGAITAEEYQAWTKAVPNIKLAYDRLYKLWLAGENPDMLRQEINKLKLDIELWLLRVRRTH